MLRKVSVCVGWSVWIVFHPFAFPHCEQVLVHTSRPNMHCFSQCAICSCFGSCVLLFSLLLMVSFSLTFILGVEHQDVLPLNCSLSHIMLFAFTHFANSSGLICCSLPLPLTSASPLSTNGLNGSGSQSANTVGGKIIVLLF